MKLPSEIKPEDITAIIDTREQTPFTLSPLKTVRGTLVTGDYSIVGLEHCVALERKSLSDFLGCVGGERERFERELKRMLAYETRAVLCEFCWNSLELGLWDSKVTAASAIGSVIGWETMGIPFIFADPLKNDELGNPVPYRDQADKRAARMLVMAAKRRWREARGLVMTVAETK